MSELHEKLRAWTTGRPDVVAFEPRGLYDVFWCPYSNIPVVLSYDKDGEPDCEGCERNFEATTHAFICSIRRPRSQK